jgi:transposase-like protein
MSKRKRKLAIEIYKKKAGNVSETCKAMGIPRSTFYNWKKENEDFTKAIEEYDESLIDFGESQLLQLMKGTQSTFKEEKDIVDKSDGKIKTLKHIKVSEYPPDTSAVIFFLKTKGKKRGYVEKTEVDSNIRAGITFGEIPDEVMTGLK